MNAALILLYHRIARVPQDPQWLCVAPAQFDEQMEVLARRWRPMALAELAQFVREGDVPENAVAVTFDDGYADNWTAGEPILTRYGIPASIFVTTHGDAPECELWWDELERLIFGPHRLPRRLVLEAAGRLRSWNLDPVGEVGSAVSAFAWNVSIPADTPRRTAYSELHQLLRTEPAESRWRTLNQLRLIAGLSREPRESHRLMTAEEIAEAAAHDLIEIGAHTVTHPVLAALSPDDQRWEMSASRERLEDIIHSVQPRERSAHRAVAHRGGMVNSISYPYGGRRDYTATTVEIAKSIGFTAGCANHAGRVTSGSNPLALPRMLVRDWNGDEFARRIERAFLSELPAAARGGIPDGSGRTAPLVPDFRSGF